MNTPPRWLETLLLLLLAPRDRDTIAGDLLELYREEKHPQHGALMADLWYAHQVASLAIANLFAVPNLALASLATLGCGAWLGMMELVLQQQGFESRFALSLGIMAQALQTLLHSVTRRRLIPLLTLVAGSLGVVTLGAMALVHNLAAVHFEGFAVIIGMVLITQGLMTLKEVYRPANGMRHG